MGLCNPCLKQVSRTTLAPVDDDDDELPEEGRQLDRLGVGASAIKFSARCRRADGASCLLRSAGCWLQAGGNGAERSHGDAKRGFVCMWKDYCSGS